jgi:hypothetical protein
VQAVEGDLTEGGAVGEEGFPVGEGGGTEGGEGLGGVLFAEGEVGEADLVMGEVEAGELRLELGQSALERLLEVGGAAVPEVPGGEGQESRGEKGETEEVQEEPFSTDSGLGRRRGRAGWGRC